MEENLYHLLLKVMPPLAVVVFIALFFVKAGYGIFRTKTWGISVPNKLGWILMECPVFFVMLYLWSTSPCRWQPAPIVFLLLFEAHYFQRSFVFPFLLRGKSRMPVSILTMGVCFNLINGFLLGEDLFHLGAGRYPNDWLASPLFVAGTLVFLIGMAINLHSDHVIRHLRPAGDTRHYLPQKGMYRYVTSANYLGELTEWTGFALLTQSEAAWIFVLWTFANLAPRAFAIHRRYRTEFGDAAVGSRKCLIPFLF